MSKETAEAPLQIRASEKGRIKVPVGFPGDRDPCDSPRENDDEDPNTPT